jgi:exonuclease III
VGTGPVTVHNLYVPAGGDARSGDQPEIEQKLAFLDEMRA